MTTPQGTPIATMLAAALMAALALTAAPAVAQTMGTLVPTLTWPDGTVTASTRGCDPAAVCILEE
ncbi:MAG: hypothetical protein R3D63_14275 [Paracoccaceae bacterium]